MSEKTVADLLTKAIVAVCKQKAPGEQAAQLTNALLSCSGVLPEHKSRCLEAVDTAIKGAVVSAEAGEAVGASLYALMHARSFLRVGSIPADVDDEYPRM